MFNNYFEDLVDYLVKKQMILLKNLTLYFWNPIFFYYLFIQILKLKYIFELTKNVLETFTVKLICMP